MIPEQQRQRPTAASAPRPTIADTWRLPFHLRFVVGYMRRERPAWGRLYRAVGGMDDARWRDAPSRRVVGKLHGYEMEFDLTQSAERLSWCLGRYYDLPIQQFLTRVLHPGDAFVDVGANLGMLALLARSLVGTDGKVVACEPNPRLVARLRDMLAANRLGDVDVVDAALGDASGTVELNEFAGQSAWGTLSKVGPDGAALTGHTTVQLRPADDVIATVPARHPLLVKIDVEGHEVAVLRGLARSIPERWPLLLIEVADAHQRRAGYSEAMLREEVERRGYRGFAIAGRRKFLGHDFALHPISQPHAREVDAVFVPPHGPWVERMASLLG